MSTKRVVLTALVVALAGAVLVFVLVSMMLPDQWQVQTSRDVGAPGARVAALVGDLSTWEQWSTMTATLGAQTDCKVLGAAGQPGQALQWSGSQGTATLTLTRVAEDRVEYEFRGTLANGEPYPWHAEGRIEWPAGEGAGRKVTWWERGTWQTWAGRWFGWFGVAQERVKQIQVTSLEGLATALEPGAK